MARVTLRIPDSLHEELRKAAAQQGVSLNTVLVAAAAHWATGAKASAWLQANRDGQAITNARALLNKRRRAQDTASHSNEHEAGEWAADIVRAHRHDQGSGKAG